MGTTIADFDVCQDRISLVTPGLSEEGALQAEKLCPLLLVSQLQTRLSAVLGTIETESW